MLCGSATEIAHHLVLGCRGRRTGGELTTAFVRASRLVVSAVLQLRGGLDRGGPDADVRWQSTGSGLSRWCCRREAGRGWPRWVGGNAAGRKRKRCHCQASCGAAAEPAVAAMMRGMGKVLLIEIELFVEGV